MPMFKFHCPHCNQKIEINEIYLSQCVNCPSCKEDIIVAEDIDYDSLICTEGKESSRLTDSQLHEKNLKETPASAEKSSGSNRGEYDSSCKAESPSSESPKNNRKYINCPFCGKTISEAARRCRFCGESLNSEDSVKAQDVQRRRSGIYPIVLLCVLAAIGGIVFYIVYQRKVQQEQIQQQRKILSLKYEAFRHNLLVLMDAGTKLTTTTRTGIRKEELNSAINQIEATSIRTVESLPSEFADYKEIGDAFLNIKIAIYGWRLTLQCWEVQLNSSGSSSHGFLRQKNPFLYDDVYKYLQKKLVGPKDIAATIPPDALLYNGRLIFITDYCVLDDAIGALLSESSNYYLSGHQLLLLFQKNQDKRMME